MPWPPRTSLAHLPTPLWSNSALNELLGLELWVKRDDMSAGAAAGNKIRKLEYLLCAALERGCQRVITCGGEQSNHARATAICAAQLGMKATLFLRAPAPPTYPPTGNLLLDQMVGAEVRWITPEEYRSVGSTMQQAKREHELNGTACAVIVEGGSSGLGAFGYVQAMQELRAQLDAGLAGGLSAFEAIVHACGSGGTAAGCALGAALTEVGRRVLAVPVCDNAQYFERRVSEICDEARALCPELPAPVQVDFPEGSQGPGYGMASREQWQFLRQVAQCSGLVLDPVYSGKALFGLKHLPRKPRRALFIHTGGLPGLLAQASNLSWAESSSRV